MSDPLSAPVVALDDIQAGIFDPTALAVETHLFLAVSNASSGCAFLRKIISEISTEADVAASVDPLSQVRVNIGVTCPGLVALGVDPAVIDSFPEEFRDGMPARSTVLGDNGASAPDNWDQCFQPVHGQPSFHLWMMVQAPDIASRDQKVAEIESVASAHDVTSMGREDGAQLAAEFAPAKEHFGFNDNLSQPGVAGVGQPVYSGQGTLLADGTWKPIPVGCFLLGYKNGFETISSRPSDETLRTNSTFMVFRKLKQDVAAFRTVVAETAQLLDVDDELCAAKFVGRWRSGAPLELTPDHDDPTTLHDPDAANAFAYRTPSCPHEETADVDGQRVPRLAHIRRVNPRDALSEGSIIDPTNHRIIRRSAPYGPYLPVSSDVDDGQERGLLFRAFNASILDQFELIQSEWVNNANETNGLSTDRDPLVGSAEPMNKQHSPSFTIPLPDGSCPTRYDLPQFVTVKGGAYFFIPSMRALAHLATGPTPAPSPSPQQFPPFVETYGKIVVAPGNPPEAVLREQVQLVLLYQGQLVKLGNQLRANDATKIFPTSIGVLVSTYADTLDIFTRDTEFSVGGYGERLIDITGPFILGMDAGPQYDHESTVMRYVAPASDLPMIASWADRYAASAVKFAAGAQGSTFDLVATVSDRVPLAFVDHYLGVPGPSDRTLMTWLQAIGIYVFEWWSTLLPVIKNTTTSMAPQFEMYLDGLIAQRSAAIDRGDPNVPDDVLTRLLKLPGVDGPSHAQSLDRLGIRRNLAGFALGSSVALSTAIVSAVEYLLQPTNAAALATTQTAALAGDDALVQKCMLEAARLGEPSPPSVFRTARTDVVLGKDTPRATHVPKGSIVVLNPAMAMTDPDHVVDPMTFRTDRDMDIYLMFGAGQHGCFGTAIGVTLLGAVGKHLFALNGLHQVEPMTKGHGFPGTGYPGAYKLSTTR